MPAWTSTNTLDISQISSKILCISGKKNLDLIFKIYFNFDFMLTDLWQYFL